MQFWKESENCNMYTRKLWEKVRSHNCELMSHDCDFFLRIASLCLNCDLTTRSCEFIWNNFDIKVRIASLYLIFWYLTFSRRFSVDDKLLENAIALMESVLMVKTAFLNVYRLMWTEPHFIVHHSLKHSFLKIIGVCFTKKYNVLLADSLL